MTDNLETRIFFVKTAIEILKNGYCLDSSKVGREAELKLTLTNIHRTADDLITIVHALAFERNIVAAR